MIGGTASAISGGKFSNGAVTAAFSRLLNDDAVKKDPKQGEEGAITSEDSQMTKNKDGYWQTRENAALAAAGLNPDTSTHSCSTLSVHACSLTGTVAGEGETTISGASDNVADAVETASEITDKVKVWHAKAIKYVVSFPVRYQDNLQYCRSICGKQRFQIESRGN
jgi:hypothetical protein